MQKVETEAQEHKQLRIAQGLLRRVVPYLTGSLHLQRTVHLTEREREILRLYIEECLAHKEISARLDISIKTTERHVSNIHKKVGTHSGLELARWAVRNNLVSWSGDSDTGGRPPEGTTVTS